MGCTQSTPTIAPMNQMPIERVFNAEDCTEIKPPPVVIIQVEPPPPYIKGVLKKNQSIKKTKPNIISMINAMPPPLSKTVNFDGQVLVRDRTPTPRKHWYEKASSTMPMRKGPRNDEDDYDYDQEDTPSILSDEDYENNTTTTPLQQSNLPTQWNQPNLFWPHPDTDRELMPITNNSTENDSFLPTMQQPAYNRTENSNTPPINCIKVRRNVSALGPPQITSPPSYASPVQPTNVFSNQTTFPSSYRPLIHSPYLSRPSTLPRTTNAPLEQRPPFYPNGMYAQTTGYGYSRQPIENRT